MTIRASISINSVKFILRSPGIAGSEPTSNKSKDILSLQKHVNDESKRPGHVILNSLPQICMDSSIWARFQANLIAPQRHNVSRKARLSMPSLLSLPLMAGPRRTLPRRRSFARQHGYNILGRLGSEVLVSGLPIFGSVTLLDPAERAPRPPPKPVVDGLSRELGAGGAGAELLPKVWICGVAPDCALCNLPLPENSVPLHTTTSGYIYASTWDYITVHYTITLCQVQ